MRRFHLFLLLLVPLLLLAFAQDRALGAEKSLSPALLKDLGAADPATRAKAIDAIVKIGKAAGPALRAELSRGTEASRCAALLCIGRVKDYGSLAAVRAFLKKAKTMMERTYALKALGVVGNASSRMDIKLYLTYKAPKRLDESKVGWIAEKARETEQGLVRNQAAESLARQSDFTGVSVLIENLGSNGWVRRDAHIRLRRMTGCKVDFGYNLGESREERQKAIDKWKAWWKKNRLTFRPRWTKSHKVFDVNKRGG